MRDHTQTVHAPEHAPTKRRALVHPAGAIPHDTTTEQREWRPDQRGRPRIVR